MRGFTKMAISGATLGIRRPTSTTFVGIFKGYNFVVYTKTKFWEEVGQKRQESDENLQCQNRGRGFLTAGAFFRDFATRQRGVLSCVLLFYPIITRSVQDSI